jgi:tetratricopeptide (TPR) repeat protein
MIVVKNYWKASNMQVDIELQQNETEKDRIIKLSLQLLEESSQKFEKAVEIRHDYSNALNSWGLLLSTHAKLFNGEESDIYYAKAYEKFKEAFKYTMDDDSYVICNWAMTLISQAKKKFECGDIEKYNILLNESYEKLSPKLKELDSWSMFCMARWCSVANKEDECRDWLNRFQEKDNYLHKATKSQMSYFKNMVSKEWYINIIMKPSCVPSLTK